MQRIKELISKVERINDYYSVGPVQRAALEDFANLIILECAKIAEDCYEYHEPLSKVPKHITRFERLTDANK